jgi:hypothetical protein
VRYGFPFPIVFAQDKIAYPWYCNDLHLFYCWTGLWGAALIFAASLFRQTCCGSSQRGFGFTEKTWQ